VATACSFFGVQDRVNIQEDVLDSLYVYRLSEEPTKAEEINRHYKVLKDFLSGQLDDSVTADYDSPVGLSNMGNTCYLNCLLQYFYTLKPFRDLVLNFDEYKIDTSDADFQPKRVDNQIISKLHVRQFQNCKSH
jgi:ubiquitin carboxyl-terminal hydrolase 25